MALDYISDTITREEFYEKIHSKSGSASAVETAKAHITNLDYFSKDKYGKETDTILRDLKNDMSKTQSPTKVLRFLDEFVKWLLKDHPRIILHKGRNNSVKYFLRKKNNANILLARLKKEHLILLENILFNLQYSYKITHLIIEKAHYL